MPDILDPEADADAVADDPAATALMESEAPAETEAEPEPAAPSAPAIVGTAAPTELGGDEDLHAITYFKEAHASIKRELAKVIVGQHEVIDQLLIAIVTRSHALLVGVPGLAKTLLISTLAQAMT